MLRRGIREPVTTMSPPALSSLSGLVAASCTARPFASGAATHAPSALGTLPSGHGAVEGASSVACAAAGVAIATAKATSEPAPSRGAGGKQGVIIGRILALRVPQLGRAEWRERVRK